MSSTIYYCPYCDALTPGWLKYPLRNEHIKLNHEGKPYPLGDDGDTPNGGGYLEWRLEQLRMVPNKQWALTELIWTRNTSYNQRGPWHLLGADRLTVCGAFTLNWPQRQQLEPGVTLPAVGKLCHKCRIELEHTLPATVIITPRR